jgi:hypothetical protein
LDRLVVFVILFRRILLLVRIVRRVFCATVGLVRAVRILGFVCSGLVSHVLVLLVGFCARLGERHGHHVLETRDSVNEAGVDCELSRQTICRELHYVLALHTASRTDSFAKRFATD